MTLMNESARKAGQFPHRVWALARSASERSPSRLHVQVTNCKGLFFLLVPQNGSSVAHIQESGMYYELCLFVRAKTRMLGSSQLSRSTFQHGGGCEVGTNQRVLHREARIAHLLNRYGWSACHSCLENLAGLLEGLSPSRSPKLDIGEPLWVFPDAFLTANP